MLTNEMFATLLGRWLGLPMPRVAAIEVSDWLVQHSPELRMELANTQVLCSSGLQFGSQYPCDPANEPMEVFDYLLESLLENSALRGVYARNCVCKDVTGWESFEPVLTRAEADMLYLWRCAEQIPPEWYGHDADALRQIVEGVYERRNHIRELIEAFRTSSRNPFPN